MASIMTDQEREIFRRKLEAWGVDTVQQRLDSGIFQGEQKSLAETFVADERRLGEAAQSEALLRSRGDAIRIAREANEIATKANRNARVANAVAVGAFLVAAIALLVALGII